MDIRTLFNHGRFAHLNFTDEELLQTLHLSGKTAMVNIDAGVAKGCVGLVNGNVLTASLEEKVGEEAFYELLALPQGSFEVRIGEQPGEPNLSESTEFLLLEALRRLDERRRV